MAERRLIEGDVAFVFPGQGSQFVGMAAARTDAPSAAQRVLDDADEILGFPISDLMRHGPDETLADTINAQPAILTASLAAVAALEERLELRAETLRPAVVAGHSLGEFTALVVSGVLDFSSALNLVRERGRLMKEAGQERPGGMAAILGLNDDVLADVCAEASEDAIVVLANVNCPGQIVISGEIAALERAMALAKERGAKRATRLNVSIASHSPLMADANARFAALVAATALAAPTIPVVGNVDARPLTTARAIRDEISRQMERPVDWTGSVRAIIESGVRTFVEPGPGTVLTGLIKRIDRDVTLLSLSDLDRDDSGRA